MGHVLALQANHENFKTFDTNARNSPWAKAEL